MLDQLKSIFEKKDFLGSNFQKLTKMNASLIVELISRLEDDFFELFPQKIMNNYYEKLEL